MISGVVFASEPDFSVGRKIKSPIVNPYRLNSEDLEFSIRQGRLHALQYPIVVSGVLAPWNLLERGLDDVISRLFNLLPRDRLPIPDLPEGTGGSALDQVFAKIGLHSYPNSERENELAYFIPFPESGRPKDRMGVGRFDFPSKRGVAEVMTLSCAACHSANLFGVKILGLTNRFPRANEFFYWGKKAVGYTNPSLMEAFLPNVNKAEFEALARLKERTPWIDVKVPEVMGLDTSLAQVSRSLTLRKQDSQASRVGKPDESAPNFLKQHIADSKPMPWWNVKYKNRWLADGSVLSGNPIATNLLWNELGRGTDLNELKSFLNYRIDIVRDLTTAVFSSEAPRFEDFFDPYLIDEGKAKRGEILFNNNCAKCHGVYEKAWSRPGAPDLAWKRQIQTLRVLYPEETKVFNVGTDPGRYEGMKELAQQLNRLDYSKELGVVVEPQVGYVPPPLVGIWARWPYFHNNSVPTLCDVLRSPELRPQSFYMGEALNPETDFDVECNGYPLGETTPKSWKNADFLFDTTKKGLSNSGHFKKTYSEAEIRDLVSFLQTL